MDERNCTLGRFERQCPTCGTVFEVKRGRGHARRYCTSGCKPERVRVVLTAPCSVPGCSRAIRSSRSPHCEMHYYRLRRNGVIGDPDAKPTQNHCDYCGSATADKRFCDSACRARFDRGNPLVRECVVCAATYDPRSTHGRDRQVCGSACEAARSKGWGQAMYARYMATPHGREKVRSNEYRRKARKRAAFVDDVKWSEVMERGGWACHLCGGKIPKARKWPDPLFGTVDHVLPLAKGGEHSYANCKPAHLSCNCSKGDKPLGQLGLPLGEAA